MGRTPVDRSGWGRRLLGSSALAVLALIGADRSGVAPATRLPPPWRVGTAVPIALNDGQARFEVPTPDPGSKTLVIVSSLARSSGSFPIRLTARSAGEARPPALAVDGPTKEPDFATPDLDAVPEPPGGRPPIYRTFHLLVRDGDAASATNYEAVPGRLRALGRRVQVYVDENDLTRVSDELLRDVVQTFDERVFPTSARLWGPAVDIDGDGRFTILLTSWLARLGGGSMPVDGFVRGADLDPGLASPFGNRCDMMYLNATLCPGPHLRTVLAHEYTHAVTFSRKVAPGPDGPRGLEEEGWLDEALAHLVEDVHGFTRSNLDYRVSAFLSAPERYRLVVEDYYTADLFRSHGNRGSTYLFLRWCSEQYGPKVLPALIGSKRRGIANLEAVTGQPFARLYRQWSTSLYWNALIAPGDRSEDAKRAGPESNDWLMVGPRASTIEPDGPEETWVSEGTSSHFAVVNASATGAASIEVTGPPGADLQVTAVPLPGDRPELTMTVASAVDDQEAVRIKVDVREHAGAPVRLDSLAWEPLVPAADARASGFRRGRLDSPALGSAFGGLDLPARGGLNASAIPLPELRPGDGPIVFKLIGTDARGRRVAAWADFNLQTVAVREKE